MSKYLDSTGLTTLWSKIKEHFILKQTYTEDMAKKQNSLGISSSGSTTKFLNQQGNFVENSASPSISITYDELVKLVDSSKLIPGMQYRITDYRCTTVQEGTQSADHQFDIIVTADDNHTLNENARAIQHEGDTYFANSNLKAWQLKYSLKNDTNRFAWAMDGYYELVYNFWSEMAGRNKDNSVNWVYHTDSYTIYGDATKVTYNGKDYLSYDFVGNTNANKSIFLSTFPPKKGDKFMVMTKDSSGNYTPASIDIKDEMDGSTTGTTTEPSILKVNKLGRGIIYYMKDEFNNECPYDFKNIQFKVFKISVKDGFSDKENFSKAISSKYMQTESINTNFPIAGQDDFKYFYTFNSINTSNNISDASLSNSNCGSNYIGTYKDSTYKLNKIIFESEASNNRFEDNCHDMVFVGDSTDNHFGTNCRDNVFNSCTYSTFGTEYYGNYILNKCVSVHFGGWCNNNILTLVTSCTFGDYFYNNICKLFDTALVASLFGERTFNNKFTSGLGMTIVGKGCVGNTFGALENSNFGSDLLNCTLIQGNEITIGEYCQGINIVDRNTANVIIENCTKNITIQGSGVEINPSHNLQNIYVRSSASGKTLNITSLDNTFVTTFGSSNDVVVNV